MRPNYPRSRIVEVFSLSLAGAGAVFWILAILLLRSEASRLAQAGLFSASLSFIFFATQLTIVGVAFYAYSLSRKNRGEDDEAESTLDMLEVLLNRQKETATGSTTALRLDLDTLRGIQSRQG